MPVLDEYITTPKPSRRFYTRKSYWLLAFILLILFWYLKNFTEMVSENYHAAPPVGTRYAIVDNTVDGFAMVNGYWGRVCAMAPGGTLTVEKNLFWRENVRFGEALTDIYETALFHYTPPEIPPSGPGRMTAALTGIPWCPAGFTHTVPIHTYVHRLN